MIMMMVMTKMIGLQILLNNFQILIILQQQQTDEDEVKQDEQKYFLLLLLLNIKLVFTIITLILLLLLEQEQQKLVVTFKLNNLLQTPTTAPPTPSPSPSPSPRPSSSLQLAFVVEKNNDSAATTSNTGSSIHATAPPHENHDHDHDDDDFVNHFVKFDDENELVADDPFINFISQKTFPLRIFQIISIFIQYSKNTTNIYKAKFHNKIVDDDDDDGRSIMIRDIFLGHIYRNFFKSFMEFSPTKPLQIIANNFMAYNNNILSSRIFLE